MLTIELGRDPRVDLRIDVLMKNDELWTYSLAGHVVRRDGATELVKVPKAIGKAVADIEWSEVEGVCVYLGDGDPTTLFLPDWSE